MWSLGVCQLIFVALVCGGVIKKDEGEGDGKDIVQNIIKINEKNHLADEENEANETDVFQSILDANANAKNVEDENDPATSKPILVEGDIIKTKAIETLVSGQGSEDEQEDAISNKRYRWPKLIPYYFERSSSQKMRKAVYSAIAGYEKKTCLRFKEISPYEGRRYKGFIQFFRGGGCFSYVGMMGGEQQISIGNGCEYHGIATHEIMHALGFFHEQSRRDRDNYIKVHFENIPKDKRSQFRKYKQGEANTMNFPYDTSSIMHYGPYAFSGNGKKTITLLPGNKGPIGQRNGLSEIDVQQLNAVYCGGGSRNNCRDARYGCNRIRSYCSLGSYRNYMRKNCAKTCGMC